MSKQCKGPCKRLVNEYYLFKDGGVLCYDCWKRAVDQNQRLMQEFEQFKRREAALEEQYRQLKYEDSMNQIDDTDYDSVGAHYRTIPKDYAKAERITQMYQKLNAEKEALRKMEEYLHVCRRQTPVVEPNFLSNAQYVKEP